jgi:hypothetical protein
MVQLANIEEVFREYFAKAIVPDRIIELGTCAGDFSLLIYNLRREINEDFDFITFDHQILINIIPEKMSFCQGNIFEHIDFIGSLIKENTLILCDNGDKIREVHSLYPYLKKNCVIMAHDYFSDRQEFEQRKCWSACEITDADVKDLNLKPYLQDTMKKGIWLSMIYDT